MNYKPKSLGDEQVPKPTVTTFRKALDFGTYRLRYHGSRINAYDKSKVDSRKKRLKVEIDSHMLNPADPISILDFLQTFKRACNNISMHDGAAIFLFSHFMVGSAKYELLNRIEGDSDTKSGSENAPSGSLRSYDEVVNRFLAT